VAMTIKRWVIVSIQSYKRASTISLGNLFFIS
jgi:hypothetical protein